MQAQQQRLGVFDVIRLSQNGLEDQLIINQIRSTGSTFQLTTSDLESLKSNGVSASVISEMQVARATVVPIGARVAQPNTVIIEQPVYPTPVYVRPMYGPPRPVIFVGGRTADNYPRVDPTPARRSSCKLWGNRRAVALTCVALHSYNLDRKRFTELHNPRVIHGA